MRTGDSEGEIFIGVNVSLVCFKGQGYALGLEREKKRGSTPLRFKDEEGGYKLEVRMVGDNYKRIGPVCLGGISGGENQGRSALDF